MKTCPRHPMLFAAVALVALTLPGEAEGQLARRLRETAEQSLADKKLEAEDEVVLGAGDRVNSAVEFASRPVVGVMEDVAAGLDSLAVRIVRGLGGGPDLAAELREGLAAGGADLELGYVFGSPEPDAGAEAALEALALVVAKAPDPALLEGRVYEGEPADLGRVRAEIVRDRLIAGGADPARLFVVSRREPESPVLLGVRYLR